MSQYMTRYHGNDYHNVLAKLFIVVMVAVWGLIVNLVFRACSLVPHIVCLPAWSHAH